MRKIALETVIFKKKNRYLRIDFLLILKRALWLLFLENVVYLVLQLCACFVRSFRDAVAGASVAFPVVAAVLYLVCVALILAFQTSDHSSLLGGLKVGEFVLFSLVLSSLLTAVCLSAQKVGFTSISVVNTLNIILVLLWVRLQRISL